MTTGGWQPTLPSGHIFGHWVGAASRRRATMRRPARLLQVEAVGSLPLTEGAASFIHRAQERRQAAARAR